MPDLEQWSTGRLLTTAARLSEHALNEALVRTGVTHAGISILRVLDVHGDISQNALAGLMHVQPQTIGTTLERLESTGHVFRTPGSHDRRIRLVSLSVKGRAPVDQANAIEDSLGVSNEAHQDALRTSLRSVIEEFRRS